MKGIWRGEPWTTQVETVHDQPKTATVDTSRRHVHGRKRSHTPEVRQEVKQGGVLSPSLYKLYIFDLLRSLRSAGLGVHIGHLYLGTPSCADDVLLLSNLPQDMQGPCWTSTLSIPKDTSTRSILVHSDVPPPAEVQTDHTGRMEPSRQQCPHRTTVYTSGVGMEGRKG